MTETVKAYKSIDGTVHPTEWAAKVSDFHIRSSPLVKSMGGTVAQGYADWTPLNVHTVYDLLRHREAIEKIFRMADEIGVTAAKEGT